MAHGLRNRRLKTRRNHPAARIARPRRQHRRRRLPPSPLPSLPKASSRHLLGPSFVKNQISRRKDAERMMLVAIGSSFRSP